MALAAAETLLHDARNASAFARRMKRMPHPDDQQETVAAARQSLAEMEGRVAAVSGEWRVAQEQHAEVERLFHQLEQWKEHPSMEACRAALQRAEEDARTANTRLAGAEHKAASRIRQAEADADAFSKQAAADAEAAVQSARQRHRDASAAVEAMQDYLTRFREYYGAAPADVLAEAAAALAKLDALRSQYVELSNDIAERETRLSRELDEAREALRRFEFRVSAGNELEPLLRELEALVPQAVAEADRHQPEQLSSESDALRGRMRVVETELAQIEERLEQIEREVINDATVVACTLTKSYLSDEIQGRQFDTVVLDEASMAPIPALWMAASVAERNVVVVGDPDQLPPIALAADEHDQDSPAARWLARDIFAVAGLGDTSAQAPYLVELRTQYRMHPAISVIPNRLVYQEKLRDGPNTHAIDGLARWYDRDWGHDAPVLRIDTERADAWCSTVLGTGRPSRLNFLSATVAVDLAQRLLRHDRPPAAGGEARIIIITPYRPQARLLSLLLRDVNLEGEVIAGTVHSFQGSEAPVVIYDLVVDDPHRKAGMFAPAYNETTKRQFNVGLTRAKHRLFLVADFDFLARHGKRAFAGDLIRELDTTARVDAETIAGLGLNARAARAQSMASGEEPPDVDRVVVTQTGFDELFLHDLDASRSRIVIYSPFITHNRLEKVGLRLRAAVDRGVPVYVVTKALDDRGIRERSTYQDLQRRLRSWGIFVVPKKAMHEKLVFVDDDIVWVGSLNPLSFRDTREIMERRRSKKVSEDYRKTLQLDIAFSAYEQGDDTCPICGSELALAESRYGLYLRCTVPHCYTRRLSDPPLRDGKMSCHSCGAELYYGSWGDTPAWRCRENTRHRMELHPNHLRLPAMRNLISAKELRRLERYFAQHNGRRWDHQSEAQTEFDFGNEDD
jgi:hypothetical protein